MLWFHPPNCSPLAVAARPPQKSLEMPDLVGDALAGDKSVKQTWKIVLAGAAAYIKMIAQSIGV